MSDEFNKKIVKLKGLCWHDFEDQGYGIGYICNHCRIRVQLPENLNSYYLPDWQNNIADAWELFEELPPATTLQKLHNGFIIDIPLEQFPETFYEKTAPEAICKAFIAWKET